MYTNMYINKKINKKKILKKTIQRNGQLTVHNTKKESPPPPTVKIYKNNTKCVALHYTQRSTNIANKTNNLS